MSKKILVGLIVIFSAFFTSIIAAPAQAYSCTTVWLTAPSYYGHIETGKKRCLYLNDTSSAGWIKIYRLDDRSLIQIDWLNPYDYTRVPPNNGLYKPNADRARAFAADHHVYLQFAKSNEVGSVGCTGDFTGQISGTYHPSGRRPGKGLVRLGTGTTDTCMRNRDEVMDTTRHEVAHALEERHCPASLNERRHENVTDAFAWKFLGATNRHPGNYGFTSADLTRAYQILHYQC